jgi:hypothetical protein
VLKFRRHRRSVLTPGSGRRHGVIRESYTLGSAAHGVLLVNGHQAEFTQHMKVHGVLTWRGRLRGRPAPVGTYVLAIAAQDEAGNRSKPLRFAVVRIRYLSLPTTTIHVKRRQPFTLTVHTFLKSVSWRFAGGQGRSRTHLLRLRAPRKPGRYGLYVTASGHTATATVVVG